MISCLPAHSIVAQDEDSLRGNPNKLIHRAASRAAEHLSSLKAAEEQEAERRKIFAEQLEGLEKENKRVAAQSEAEIAEQKADLASLLACALGDSLSGYETQAQQVMTYTICLPCFPHWCKSSRGKVVLSNAWQAAGKSSSKW